MNLITSFIIHFFLFAQLAHASQLWNINKDHTQIEFKVTYLSLSDISGRLSEVSGNLKTENEFITEGILKIDVQSIYTGNKIRDAHLRSSDFINLKKYPHILFLLKDRIPFKEGKFLAKGELSLNGITKIVPFEIQIGPNLKDTWNFDNRFIKFNSKIKRHDFNINWDKSIQDNKHLVGEEIELFGQIQIQPSQEKTPTHKFMIPDTKFTREKDKLNRGEISKISFEQQDKSTDKNEPIITQDSEVMIEKSENISSMVQQNRSLGWWASLLTLGMMALSFAIYASYSLKMFAEKKYGERYVEEKHIGIITDLLALAIITLFAVCFWVIGWGQ